MKNLIIAIVIIYTTYNTAKYAVRVWKTTNKLGSLAVLLLAVGILVLPFFMHTLQQKMYNFVEWLDSMDK